MQKAGQEWKASCLGFSCRGSAYNIIRGITMCQVQAQVEVELFDAGGNGEQPR